MHLAKQIRLISGWLWLVEVCLFASREMRNHQQMALPTLQVYPCARVCVCVWGPVGTLVCMCVGVCACVRVCGLACMRVCGLSQR